jgi:hypothetical protein
MRIISTASSVVPYSGFVMPVLGHRGHVWTLKSEGVCETYDLGIVLARTREPALESTKENPVRNLWLILIPIDVISLILLVFLIENYIIP